MVLHPLCFPVPFGNMGFPPVRFPNKLECNFRYSF